jgi:hypothetical protein
MSESILGSLLVGGIAGFGTFMVLNKVVAPNGWCQPQPMPLPVGALSVPGPVMPGGGPMNALLPASNPLCTQTLMQEPLAQWIPWVAAPAVGFLITGSIWGLIGGAAVDAFGILAGAALSDG